MTAGSEKDAEWRILIIDDEADIREVLQMVLADAGFLVAAADNGNAGLHQCESDPPHIVVTDIRMPGMDGIEVLEQLKLRYPDIEVIVITAFSDMAVAIRALQLDASDFITKPINEAALHIALKRAKERYTAKKEIRAYTALLEQQLVDQGRILHQDKMMSLGRLAASIVHEINNPLSGMLNYMHLMKRILGRGPLEETARKQFQEYLSLVESETSRCSKIVSNLLSFSKTSEPVFEPVDVKELLNRSLLLSQHRLALQQISCSLSIPDGLPPVLGDFNQLQQCLINLLFNAVDAMPDGGNLWVSAEYRRPANRLCIEVRDSGAGISASDLSRIFEPFFSTKAAGYGVGLGLSTVYGIVEKHGGHITAESEPGQGACFKMRLPVKANIP